MHLTTRHLTTRVFALALLTWFGMQERALGQGPAGAPAPAPVPPSSPSEPTPPPPPPDAPPPQAGSPAPEPPPPPPPPPPPIEEPAALPAPAPEPEAVAAEAEAEPASGEMVVTGSRLADSVGKEAPVLTLGEPDLTRTGLVSVGDILQRLPASGGGINGKFNSSGNLGNPPDGGGVGAGAIEVDLRYLGSKRALVLVDGVRWINGSSASGVAAAVDLNTIPLGMIERIEILEDGASPVYGSDAIAGVINIITKKRFDGAAASAYVGGYHPFDGQHSFDGLTQKYDLTFGTTHDRLSIMTGVSYLDQREVSSGRREISDSVIPTLDNCEAGCSSITPQGRLVFVDPNTMEMQNLTLRRGTGTPVYPDSYDQWSPTAAFNYAPYNLILTPTRRISAFSSIAYRFEEWFNFHGKVAFTRRQSANQAAPEPLLLGPEAGTGSRGDLTSVSADNAYNPFGFTFDPNTNPFLLTRRPLEAGPRRFEQTVNTLYLSGGFDGKFKIGKRRFSWDTTLAYGINRADQRRRNSINSSKLGQALGPSFTDGEGVLRCGTSAMPGDPECVPFNFFGGQGANGRGTLTRRMLDYVTYTQHDISEQQLVDWLANASGEVVDLPGGPLAVGVGVEHRRLQGYFEPDAVVAAGDSADIPAKPTSGRYHVTEAYAEARAPFLANLPGVSLLDLNAAGRVSDYSFLKPEFTGRIGGRYKPIDDLVIRASYGLGFRAPSLGELYASASRFDAVLNDPCSDFNGNGVSPATRERCIGLGVPADGSYTQLQQQISVQTGGNRRLEPERSKSLNVSIAYAPAALQDRAFSDRFDVELAYWQVLLDGAIAALDAQLQIDRCIGGDDSQCNGITRTSAGSINSFNNVLLNIGGIETRGLDLKIGFQTPKASFGRFRARWLTSYMLDYWEKLPSSNGTQTVKLEGKLTGEPERAFPQLKSNLMIEWLFGDIALALTTRYIHSVTEQCRELSDFPNTCSDFNPVDDLSTNKLAPTVYNDLRFTWLPSFDDRLTISAGVNNLFNVDPPVCYSCSLNGFNAQTYDIPGVFGYINAGYQVN